jgi:hypothetical protein
MSAGVIAAHAADGTPTSAYPLDVALTTYGDHFTGPDLDTTKWTRATYVDADDTVVSSELVVAGGAPGSFYWQAPPASGDYTLTMRCRHTHRNVDSVGMFGLLLLDAANSGVGVSGYGGPDGCLLATITGTNYSGGYTSNNVAGSSVAVRSGNPSWYRLRKVGDTFYGSLSFDGSTWQAETPGLTRSGFTWSRAGFGAFYAAGSDTFEVDWFNIT